MRKPISKSVAGLRRASLAGAGIAAIVAMSSGASAGGFAVREQSAEFQGMSFAGAAASGGGLSGMFWNPAVAGQFNGLRTESHWSLILPNSEIVSTSASTLADPKFGGAFPLTSGDIGENAIVPAGYLSYQLSQQLVLGVSLNAPFGLSTRPENPGWVGSVQARDSTMKTYNGQLALAYRLMPSITLGVGVMGQYIDGLLKSASAASPVAPDASFGGNDFSLGWTAGITVRPMEGTHIGLGYRSKIEHTLTGTAQVANTTNVVGVSADLELPETATLSLRQAITPQLAFLATAEWTKWSRLQKLDVICGSRLVALGCAGNGGLFTSLPFGWHDGWFYSGGLEYAFSKSLTLRAGGAYEKSPVQNATERSPRIPDNDRIWASVGATAKVNDQVTMDFAYSHIWVDGGEINRVASTTLVGTSRASVDIVSASIKVQLGGAKAPLE